MEIVNTKKAMSPKLLLGFNLLFLMVWLNAKFLGYDYILTGALHELLWLPSLFLLFVSTLISLFYWVRQKFSIHSAYFYLLVFSAVLFGLLFGLR